MQPLHRHPNDLACASVHDPIAEGASHPVSHRRCLASGATVPKALLLRFVVGQNDDLVFDADERLPGPGYWIQADRAILERACRRGLFAKAARQRIELPAALIDHVVRRLRQRCLNAIGLARRAGHCVIGYGQTTKAVERPDISILLVAADGSEVEVAKLCARAVNLTIVDDFTAVELGAAIGRPHLVYGAVQKGRSAASLLRDVFRLRGVDSVGGKTERQTSSVSINAITELR